MVIPRSFTLFGQTINVTRDPSILWKDDNEGEAVYRSNTINLIADNPHWVLPRDRLEQIFCHEVVHFLFHAAGEKDLQSNEVLVDRLGHLLHQFLTTQKGVLK